MSSRSGATGVDWPAALLRVDDEVVDYEVATSRMREMVEERVAEARPDTLWLLSHPQLYTVGRRTENGHLPAQQLDIPVYETNRGGQLTYHGPGQVVGYLVCELPDMGSVVPFLRLAEARLVKVVEALGIPAERRDTPRGASELTGVWTRGTGRKLVSIGLRCTKRVTSHGFSINVEGDLEPWRWATPCGMPDVEMTSVERELSEAGRPVPTEADVRDVTAEILGARRIAKS